MQVTTSGTAAGELDITPAPHGGVIITIASTDILIEDTEDADRGIRAFAEAKRLLARQPCPAWTIDTATGTAVYCELRSPHEDDDHMAPGVHEGDPDIRWPQAIRRGIHPYPDMRIVHGDQPVNAQPEEQHQPVSYVAFDTPTLAGGPGGAA